jgi:hypothetical protein
VSLGHPEESQVHGPVAMTRDSLRNALTGSPQFLTPLMRALWSAEVSGVAPKGRRVVLGFAAVLLLAGVARLESTRGSDGAGAAQPFPRMEPLRQAIECPVVDVGRYVSRDPLPRGRRRGTSQTAHSAGNLTVGIPATVFISKSRKRLVVTTNTGTVPQPADSYYVTAPGKAELAGSALRSEILATCAAPSKQRSPHLFREGHPLEYPRSHR